MKLFLPLICLVLISCFNEPESKIVDDSIPEAILIEKKSPIEIDSNQLLIDEIARNYITNSSVEEKLTQFGDTNKESIIKIYTNFGTMKFRLYSNTPLHRANFILLAKKRFYDKTLFYRIIKQFMIQGGNSDDDFLAARMSTIGGYLVPNEINKFNIHKKGALAMAVPPSEQSFGKKSSAINFYIIEGRKMSSTYFEQQAKKGKKFSTKAKEIYKKTGGAPHLDGNYTVFGELISGMSVLNKITKVKTDKYDWPTRKVVIDSIRAF